MALSSPSAPLSGPSTSIAARPRIRVGGVRRRDESPEAFAGRMAESSPSAPMAVAPTRRDNILAARSDGTFDAKRDAYNKAAAAQGKVMDEAGNITSTTQPLTAGAGTPAPPPAPASTPSVPPSAGSGNPASGNQPPASPAPASRLPSTLKRPPAPRPTGGMINGMPAAQAIAQVKTAQAQVPRQTAQNPRGTGGFQMPSVATALRPPPTVTSNVTRNVTSPSPVTPPAPRPGGMLATAGRMAQQAAGALTAPNPSLVLPRAQATLQTLNQRQSTPAPAPAATPRTMAATPQGGFTGPAGIAAAQKVVQQQHAERDAADLARYQAADATNPAYNQQVMPNGQPYAFSSAGHGNAPTPARPPALTPPPRLPMLAGARADGGPVEKGKPYLMGEKGPEAVVPQRDLKAIKEVPSAPTTKNQAPSTKNGHRSFLSKPGHPRPTTQALAAVVKYFGGGPRADGGPVQAQKPYLVGEKGPEIVVPKADATVIPNHQLTPGALNPNADPGASYSVKPRAPIAYTSSPFMHTGRDWRSGTTRPRPPGFKSGFRPPSLAPSLLVAR